MLTKTDLLFREVIFFLESCTKHTNELLGKMLGFHHVKARCRPTCATHVT